MKYNHKLSSLLLTALAIASGFSLQSCKDQPDEFKLTDGTPTIDYIRPALARSSDSLLVEALPQTQICIVGSNLTSIQQMYFNDKKAILNTSYITNNTLIVQVPSEIPDVVSDKIYMITSAHDTLTYDFHIVIPAPNVAQMSCEYAAPGSTATIYGSYFIDDPNIPLEVIFPDGKTAEIKNINESRSTISIVVPDCKTEGQITVKSIYGSSKSSFRYLDSRGMLFDFDTPNAVTGAVLGNHGWHAQKIETDATALSGNFLRLGDPSVLLDAEGAWNDGNFSFEYWPGNWQDPEDYQGDGVPEVQDTRRKAASRMTNRIAPETWNVPSVHGRMLHGNICLCFPTAAKLLSGTLTDIPCSLHTPIPCYVFSAGVPPSVPVPSQPVRHTGMAHHAASFGSGLRQDRPTTMPSI